MITFPVFASVVGVLLLCCSVLLLMFLQINHKWRTRQKLEEFNKVACWDVWVIVKDAVPAADLYDAAWTAAGEAGRASPVCNMHAGSPVNHLVLSAPRCDTLFWYGWRAGLKSAQRRPWLCGLKGRAEITDMLIEIEKAQYRQNP